MEKPFRRVDDIQFPARLTEMEMDRRGNPAYGWIEQTIDGQTSELIDAEPARWGTPTKNPAYCLGNILVSVTNSTNPDVLATNPVVLIRQRGAGGEDGQLVYEFLPPGREKETILARVGEYLGEHVGVDYYSMTAASPLGGSASNPFINPAGEEYDPPRHTVLAAIDGRLLAPNRVYLARFVGHAKAPLHPGEGAVFEARVYAVVTEHLRAYRAFATEPLGPLTTALVHDGIDTITFDESTGLKARDGNTGTIEWTAERKLALSIHPASPTQAGVITVGTQEIGGPKHFSGLLSALQFFTVNCSATRYFVSGAPGVDGTLIIPPFPPAVDPTYVVVSKGIIVYISTTPP